MAGAAIFCDMWQILAGLKGSIPGSAPVDQGESAASEHVRCAEVPKAQQLFTSNEYNEFDRYARACSGAAAVASVPQQRHGSAAAAAEKLTAAQRRSWAGWALDGQRGRAAGERDAARRRLDAVLETYTDVTRFPRRVSLNELLVAALTTFACALFLTVDSKQLMCCSRL